MGHRNDKRARLLVAQEAARIIVDEGVKDYQTAKRKALDRLAFSDRSSLPRNTEIEQAIRDHRQLFFTDEDHCNEMVLWKAALKAMHFLEPFNPKLVGPILQGTAGRHAIVNLQIFSDAVEEVLFHFMDAGIPFRNTERRLRFGKDYCLYPCLCFALADAELEAVVLTKNDERHAPLSGVDGKPMRRAEIKEVAAIVGSKEHDCRPT